MFARLAEEETVHRRTFERLLASLGDYQPPETYDGEYLAYLKDFIDGKAVFKDHPRIPELARAATIVGALDFAIQREMDSILYYQEIKSLVGPDHAGTVDTIIDEEEDALRLPFEIAQGDGRLRVSGQLRPPGFLEETPGQGLPVSE